MNLVAFTGMDPITSFYFVREAVRKRLLAYRQNRSARLGKRIEQINTLLAGLDPEVWPDERAKAEADRQHLAFRKSSIDAAIYNSTH